MRSPRIFSGRDDSCGRNIRFGLLLVFIAAVISFFALVVEKDDLHRLLLLDLVEIPSLGIIALLGTDLAEALILPGLVVGIAELLALSQIYITKEGLREKAVQGLNIEVIQADAPLIISVLLICYGIVLSGFTGGGVAGLGVVFYIHGTRPPGTFRTSGDGKRYLLGDLDLRLLCLHVPPGILAFGALHGGNRYPPEGDRKDVARRNDVG